MARSRRFPETLSSFAGSFGLLACAGLLAGASACDSPDPDAAFEAFGDRSTATGTYAGDAGEGNALPDIGAPDPDAEDCDTQVTGTWFMALSATISREKPIYFELVVTESGDDTYTMSFQPLSTDFEIDLETFEETPRENNRAPVGEPTIVEGVEVNPDDSSFDFIVTTLEITGEANPISGSDITGEDVGLTGTFVDSTFGCGEASGAVVATTTVPLNGSTMALVRSDDYPSLDIVYTCADYVQPEDPCATFE